MHITTFKNSHYQSSGKAKALQYFTWSPQVKVDEKRITILFQRNRMWCLRNARGGASSATWGRFAEAPPRIHR